MLTITGKALAQVQMVLAVANLPNENGVAELTWNAPDVGQQQYTVLRKLPGESFVTLLQFSSNEANLLVYDTTYLCDTEVAYQIKTASAQSNEKTAIIKNELRPKDVCLDSVSVDILSGNVLIGWSQSSEYDLLGYQILQGSSALDYDITIGAASTHYIDTQPLPYGTEYRIAAVDSCGNRSSIPPVGTSFSAYVSTQVCSDTVHIKWDNHKKMLPHVGRYGIFMSENGAAFQSVGQTERDVHEFYYGAVLPATGYRFFVRAYDTLHQRSASSLSDTIYIDGIPLPDFFLIQNLTAVHNNLVEVTIDVDKSNAFKECRLYVASSDGVKMLHTFAYNDLDNSTTWSHQTDEHTKEILSYWAVIVDSCNKEVMATDTMNTIFLQCEKLSETSFRLSWNLPANADIDSILLCRIINDQEDCELLVLNLTSPYIDEDLSLDFSHISSLSYVVKIIESLGGKSVEHRSNELFAFLDGEVDVQIPNALSPHSYPYFKPFFTEKPGDLYEFEVYARSGKRIFYTNDTQAVWNGEDGGRVVPVGVYVYRVKIVRNGVETLRVGSITVVD